MKRPGQSPMDHASRRRGAVLLEVIAALGLFVAAAAVITSGLSASLDSVDRLRLNTHAANLAVSVISELQMGAKPLASSGAQPFEAPFAEWTFEIVVAAVDDLEVGTDLARRVEVIVRHAVPAAVYRLNQTIRAPVMSEGLGNLTAQSEL